ncbi:MAG: DUF2953 domain-containing protein [Clostridia bacterium]|nr:DUF2953 domain-containing protein [Clostridia bacterium]
MTALIIIASIIVLTVFLLTRYAGIRLRYSDDFSATITFWIIKITPGEKKKAKKPKKEKKKKKKEEEAPAAEQTADPEAEARAKRERRDAIYEMIRVVKRILPKFFGKVRFRAARLYANIATGDAASTALACGSAKAAGAILFETIDELCVLEKYDERDVRILPDFIAEESTFDIDLRFRVRLIYALKYALAVLIGFIKYKIKKDKNK